ncbi:M20/M25/M40 family metallo-hydrolase [Streptomyces sp. NEAU-H3]|uniref:M20/M25/M40 family metallo-hydrolase n=1 Tax=Streptomyces sp. NEAU-H3 TaxID=2720636 RepID=UPI00143B9AFE|nr:M20/M25/M40 family metallo-hydrolase [Streptomyces sp. NEAU-H3]NJA56654.1 M20 family dipeptidase [Streptomyces sp. NEAU-H3]
MSTAPSGADDAVGAVRAHVTAHRAAFLDDLAAWLRIPSVSAQPEHAADVRRSAEWLAAQLRATGFPTVEIWDTPGAPAVFADWPAEEPDAPTVLVYGHHDVQPAARADGWHSEPFAPETREGRLYARGAADDKGQVFFHTLGLRAHLAATGRTSPAVHLKFLVEGEEESGGMWNEDTPTVCTGMRGLVDGELVLHGPDQDIHSGSFGGAVPNPATVLARIVAALHDEDGHVAVPGFYEGVAPLSARERALFAELPFDEDAWLRTAFSHATAGESGHTTLERIWARPTAEVNGIGGGYQGEGSKTIIPSSAFAKLTFRLVDRQDPAAVEQAVRAFVEARVPAGIRAELTFGGATRPCLTPLGHPALAAVVAAMETAFEQPVRLTREGGSGPAADLADVTGAPVLFLGISVPSDGWHAPNEKVEPGLLLKGAEATAHLWAGLASRSREAH